MYYIYMYVYNIRKISIENETAVCGLHIVQVQNTEALWAGLKRETWKCKFEEATKAFLTHCVDQTVAGLWFLPFNMCAFEKSGRKWQQVLAGCQNFIQISTDVSESRVYKVSSSNSEFIYM